MRGSVPSLRIMWVFVLLFLKVDIYKNSFVFLFLFSIFENETIMNEQELFDIEVKGMS